MHFFQLSNLDRHLRNLARADLVAWLVEHLLWVCEIKVEVVIDQRHSDAKHDLSERFSSADAFAATKGAKCKRISLSAIWSQEHWRSRVEPLWIVFSRSNPNIRVILNRLEIDNKRSLILLEVNSTDVYVFTEKARHSAWTWWLDS